MFGGIQDTFWPNLSAVLPGFEFIKRYYWGLIIISDTYPSGKACLAFKNFVAMGMIQSQPLLQLNVPKNKESLNFYEKLYNNQGGENSS